MSKASVAARDIVVLLALAAATQGLVSVVLWQYGGPAAALVCVIYITFLLRLRGQTFEDIGLLPISGRTEFLKWWIKGFVTWFLILIIAGTGGYIIQEVLGPPTSEANRFGDLEGNLPLTIWWITVSWIIGAFAEEIIFRGFLINRLEVFLSGVSGKASARVSSLTTAGSIILAAVIFGALHGYSKGISGAMTVTLIGILLGTAYIVFRRNLWPVIFAHGLLNTISFLADFFGSN